MRRTINLLISILFFQACFAQSSNSVYMFSYFKDNGQDGLHLAYSMDGYKWAALNNDSSFLKPAVAKDKLMRDPCIIRGADNQFHMVWTVSWNDGGIGYASSKDLIHWSEQQFIPVMKDEPTARNCWAPEIFYDKASREYMIYWATTIPGRFMAGDTAVDDKYNHRLYYTTTKDFKTFSKTKLLYDKGFNVIDATIQKEGERYIMFLKDETKNPPQKNLRIAISNKLTSGYEKPSPPITGDYWAEGPTAIKIGGKWIVYFDKYTQHKYGAVESADLLNWTDISDKIEMPKGMRHGTVFAITKEELKNLLANESKAVKNNSLIKVLIVDGFSNHDWKETSKEVKGILSETGRFAIDITTTPSAADDTAGWNNWNPVFKNYAVIIQNTNNINTKNIHWPGKQEKQLEEYVKSGGGLYILHSANNAFAHWKEYDTMIGLGWRVKETGYAIELDSVNNIIRIPPGQGEGTTHGKRFDATIITLNRNSINKDFPDKWMTPSMELYTHARGPAENLTILSYAVDSATERKWPVEWVVSYGKGKVYNSSMGHLWKDEIYPISYRCIGFQTILIRATEWLASGKTTYPLPANFPDSASISVRRENDYPVPVR